MFWGHEAGTSPFVCPHRTQVARTACKLVSTPGHFERAVHRIQHWNLRPFCLALWCTISSRLNHMLYVAGTKFCPCNRTFSQKRACRKRKTVAVTCPRSISPSVCRPSAFFDEIIIILGCFNIVWRIYIFFFFQNKVLSPDESARKLLIILKENTFTSGSHVDYFDWKRTTAKIRHPLAPSTLRRKCLKKQLSFYG